MHELSYAKNIMKIASAYARKNNATRVRSVTISTTTLSGIEPDSFEYYWNIITKNSILANSRIIINRVPSVIHCQTCNKKYSLIVRDDSIQQCPSCGSIRTVATEQTQITVNSMQIEN